MTAEIELFTSPTCPDCVALKRWFATHGLNYRERDLRDPAVQEEARRRTGLRISPITIVNGQPLWGIAEDQIKRLKAILDLKTA
ncbi:glutaredoxin family protein [Tabrizicola sp. BL-A-41-H6]|uniref:glutaredoxin family protein n=1 Tax=Tabrizicola sp. BL-A-41-H6 TaxID=3421107 RepID=UPI003D677B66